MPKKVVVIGAGMGGLVASLYLRRAGFDVVVLEKNADVGGKMGLWQSPHPRRPAERPFRFDTGPTLLTMPDVFDRLYRDLELTPTADVRLLPIDPIAVYRWGDGTTFRAFSDPAKRQAEIAQVFPASAAGWAKLLERGRHLWEIGARAFLEAPPDPKKMSFRQALTALSLPFRLGLFEKYATRVNRLIPDIKLRQILYQYAAYSGASPFRAPGVLAVIPHVEMSGGGHYPAGGMHALARFLHAAAVERGVTFRMLCEAVSIVTHSATSRPCVTGVRIASGSTIAASAVVCNSDAVYSYRSLVEPADRPHFTDRRLDRFDPGGSGFVLMLGVDGTYPELAHHTKFMPDDPLSDITAMFEARSLPQDPSIYVCAAGRTDPATAPEGCESLFVLASAPALSPAGDRGIDWRYAAGNYRDRLVESLEGRWGLTDLSRRIVVDRMLCPDDFSQVFHANRGSIYGIGSNGLRSSFMRPKNRDPKIGGLYFAGGASHPGGGIPLVTLSGRIAAEMVSEDMKP